MSLERKKNFVATTVSDIKIGAKEILSNVLHYAPGTLEVLGGIAAFTAAGPELAAAEATITELGALESSALTGEKAVELKEAFKTASTAAKVRKGALFGGFLGAGSLKQELKTDPEASGRITNPLKAGTFAQNKNSQTDPSHILHRSIQSIADRTIPSDHIRHDSAVLPPDENTNRPIIVPHHQQFSTTPMVDTSTAKAMSQPLPSNAIPSNTGGVDTKNPITNPFH